jgi:glycosyltransferase involved in cell wall biosynthesis
MEELHAELGLPRDRFRVVPNPVLLSSFRRPANFEREGFRHGLGVRADDLLLVFVALGHFERKGLPLLLDALDSVPDLHVRLVVVGGDPDLVARYRSRTGSSSSADRVRFVGMQPDVRPYLWAADALVAPSSYEVFSLAPLQAAAAGLPLIVTRVPGVAPFFVDGEQGFAVARDPGDIASVLRRLGGLPAAERRRLGAAALRAVQRYDVASFVDNWRGIYRELLTPAGEHRA